jgi:hypothetical protein
MHHHYVAVTELGHLLSRSGLSSLKVSLKIVLGSLIHVIFFSGEISGSCAHRRAHRPDDGGSKHL